jgi:AcrR family transcriptional regulator
MKSAVSDAPRPAGGPPNPPGRPRSERVHGAIIEAVQEMLIEGTAVEALTMEAVAARAGVGKATIYRRWSHKDALVLDAVEATKDPLPELPGRSLREDLTLLVQALGRSDSRAGRMMPCLLPELQRNTELRRIYLAVLQARREVTLGVLRRGVAAGTLRPDVDVEVVASMLATPMIMEMFGARRRVNLDADALAKQVVDTVLRGISAADGTPDRAAAT